MMSPAHATDAHFCAFIKSSFARNKICVGVLSIAISIFTGRTRGRPVEKWMHKRFSEYRGIGEWFSFHPDMLSTVPPDVVPRVEKVVTRRDVRLSLKEQFRAVEMQREGLGLSSTEALVLLVAHMTDLGAQTAFEMIGGGA